MTNKIKENFTYDYIKSWITSEIEGIKISISDNFIKCKYTFNDIILDLINDWVLAILDPEEVPLFGWTVYEVKEYWNLYAYYWDYAVYDETDVLKRDKEIILNVYYWDI